MDNSKLDLLVSAYADLQKQEAELKSKKDSIKASIIEEMGDVMKYENSFHTVTRSVAETFKYTDEVGMINILKNAGYSSYVKEVVDTTAMNKFLKDGTTNQLKEDLMSHVSKTLTERLTVK